MSRESSTPSSTPSSTWSSAVAAGVRRFLAAELDGFGSAVGLGSTSALDGSIGLAARPPLSEPGRRAIHVAAIGTTAARAVHGELLASAI
ncbi:MAG: hypothetical protein ABIR68_15650, partial [Ilumatobacteraceae bacterium]